MKRIDLKLQGGLVGHLVSVPQDTDGLVWAVNVTPFRKQGILLWRPILVDDEANGYSATIFNPAAGETGITAVCAQNSLLYLIATDDHCKVVRWKPDAGVETLPFQLPLPEIEGKASMVMAGKDVAVAIEGHGIFILKYNQETDSFDELFKVGATYVGFAGGQKVLATGGRLLARLDGPWSVYVYSITLFVKGKEVKDADAKIKLRVVAANGTFESEEEYSYATLTKDTVDFESPVWSPLEFTFNQKFDPPFSIYLDVTDVEGSPELYLERASKVMLGHGYSLESPDDQAWHMHVGGTLCPNGGAVVATRGGIAGSYSGNYVQVADIGTFLFEQEFSVPTEVMGLASVGNALLVLGNDGCFYVSDWTYSAVNVEKVYPYGITSPREFADVVGGVLAWIAGRPVLFTGAGPKVMDFPFFVEPDAQVRTAFLPRYGLMLIQPVNSDYVCVYSVIEGWTVWWRWDELGNGVHLIDGCRDTLLMDNGKAYFATYGWNPDWNGYTSELAISTGPVGPEPELQIQRITVGGAVICQQDGDAYIYVATTSKYGQANVRAELPKFEVASSAGVSESLLPPMLHLEGSGLPIMFPDEHGLLFAAYKEHEAFSGQVAFPTGSSFFVALVAGPGVVKHPGALLRQITLFVEPVGGGL